MFTGKKIILPPFPGSLNFVQHDGKKKNVFLNFATCWDHAFGFQMFLKVMNLMWHLSSICEPYKFEFLFIEWPISCSYTWKTWRYYVHYNGTFGGIDDLYLIVVRGGMMVGLWKDEVVSYTLDPKNFSPAFLVIE